MGKYSRLIEELNKPVWLETESFGTLAEGKHHARRALVDALENHSSAIVREAVAWALSYHRYSKVVPYLLPALTDTSVGVRCAAFRALESLLRFHGGTLTQWLRVDPAHDSSARVRRKVENWLALNACFLEHNEELDYERSCPYPQHRKEEFDGTEDFVDSLIPIEDEKVQTLVEKGRRNNWYGIGKVRALLRQMEKRDDSRAAAHALRRMDGRARVVLERLLLTHPNPNIRHILAHEFQHRLDARSIPVLLEAMKDPDEHVRNDVLIAIEQNCGLRTRALPDWLQVSVFDRDDADGAILHTRLLEWWRINKRFVLSE